MLPRLIPRTFPHFLVKRFHAMTTLRGNPQPLHNGKDTQVISHLATNVLLLRVIFASKECRGRDLYRN
jgi:hypothetical protein